MVDKKKKGLSRKDLKAPDEVQEKLWSLSEWVEERWKPLLGGLAAVVLLWAAVGVFQEVRTSSKRSVAVSSAEVFSVLSARVKAPAGGDDQEPPPEPGKRVFESDTARLDAAIAAAEQFVAKAKGEAAETAKLMAGGLKGQKGEFEASLAAADAYLDAHPDDALAIPLLERKATALGALGRNEEAAAAWKLLAERAPTTALKALALKHVGDLYHPATNGKGADAAKAKEAYSAALALVKPGEESPAAGPLRFVYVDASRKLAMLD